MVYRRDTQKRISFEYEWDFSDKLKFEDPISGREFHADTLAFNAVACGGDKNKRTPALERLNYQLFDESLSIASIGMARKGSSISEYQVEWSVYPLKRNKGRAWNPGAPVRFYGFPDEVVAYHQNAEFVQAINLQHEKLFRSISYLGPLRTKAERLYSWTGLEPESVGYSGENTVAAILAARTRKISFGRNKKARPFEEIIASKLKDMGLIERFEVKSISDQRQEYEVKVQTRGTREWVNLPDVGFGISQVLPVLVQCLYAPPGSIILMEQPEIHLHPSAQSALADVMIDLINSRENGEDRKIQLIIETHSEHFLRRLQRRIAEDRIPRADVSAYFANITRSPATLELLEIDIFGSIINSPENFFGDEMTDIAEQARAALLKRKSQSTSIAG